MKKFSLIGSVLLFATVVTFLFIGCQKESATADATATASSEGAVMKGTDGGTAIISGLISEENAKIMAAEYAKANPNANTISVGYATKDLIAFLKTLNNKYKADSVFVYFGIYNKQTAHHPSQIGRTTVFFMGNNRSAGKGKIRTDAVDDTDPNSSSFLNTGSLMP